MVFGEGGANNFLSSYEFYIKENAHTICKHKHHIYIS